MVQPASSPGPPALLTVEEFIEYDYPAWVQKAELVRGELRLMPTPAVAHAAVAADIVFLLMSHARQHGLGHVFGDSLGYELTQLPRTVRVPDASFVRAGRISPDQLAGRLFRFAPDLAVEVLSPNERGARLEEKLYDYAAAATPAVWVVDPGERTVTVIAADAPARVLREGDTLDGGRALPGFACAVAEIFARVPR